MSQNNMENKKRISFTQLLNDNRFLLVISFLISFVLWMWVSIEKSPETQRVISGVPVQINLEDSVPKQLGLEVFGKSEFTIDVTVKGKKYVTSSLSEDDIVVTAITNYVDSSGVKNLQLKVTQKESNSEYEIVSYSANSIEVYFDTPKKLELPIEGKIETTLDKIVPDDCIVGDTVLSKNTVLISGPATEVNKISSICANITVDEVLDKTTTFDPVFKIITSDGSSLEYVKMVTDASDITVTVPVLKEVVLPAVVEFRNAPSYFIKNPLKYSVYPANVKVAIPVDMIDTVTEFVVGTIDFADISGSVNTFNFDLNQINSTYKITDKNVTKFTVKIDASQMVSRNISIPVSNFTINHTRDDYNVTINQDKDIVVKLIGMKSDIENITSDDLTIVVDTTELELSESTTFLPGHVAIMGDYPCWAVGTYNTGVIIEEKIK